MIFLGLPAAVANGINRVGIMVQNLSAFSVFTRRGFLDFKLGIWCSIPAFFGCILGVRAAIDLADDWFRKILAGVMILVLAVTLWNPNRKAFSAAGEMGPFRKTALGVVFFGIGAYAGFIQAGVGFFMIATLSLLAGIDLVRANAQKIFISIIFTLVALILFYANSKIHWGIGAILAAGQGIGGWLGGHLAIQKGEKWIRMILAVTVVLMALKLAGIFPAFS
jgi:uncharacterized protein